MLLLILETLLNTLLYLCSYNLIDYVNSVLEQTNKQTFDIGGMLMQKMLTPLGMYKSTAIYFIPNMKMPNFTFIFCLFA